MALNHNTPPRISLVDTTMESDLLRSQDQHTMSTVSLIDAGILDARVKSLDQQTVSVVSQIDTSASSQEPKAVDLGSKPLPRLPRGWARVCHETSLLLRSIGLGILGSTLSGVLSKDFQEPSKIAIRQSRVTALLRGFAIHTIPLVVSLLEIILNWRGSFYGRDFDRQAYYQIGAKVHEIAIQACLAMMVLSCIRRETTLGKGLPFGVFLGGLQFVQPSYLWSVELWSSVSTKHFPRERKVIVLAILLFSGILATTVGPSSATLLIPRQIVWSLPPSHFMINGSFQELWPDRMEGNIVPEECMTLASDDQNNLCPGGPWYQLFEAFPLENPIDGLNYQTDTLGVPLISDPGNTFSKAATTQLCKSSVRDQACSTSPQDIVLESMFNNVQDYKKTHTFKKSQQDQTHTLSTDYYQPYVAAACMSDVITDANQEGPLRFRRISETEDEYMHDQVIVSVPHITKSMVLEAPGNTSQFRLEWLDLPRDLFNDNVTAAVLLYPRDSPGLPLNITTCTLSAGWGASAAILDEEVATTFFTTMNDLPKSWPSETKSPWNAPESFPDYGNLSGYVYPQRRITVTKDWATFLNPRITSKEFNSTAVHLILSAAPALLDGLGIPRMLALLLSSGLARNGIDLAPATDGIPCEGCLSFGLKHVVFGVGYTTGGVATRLAMAVMMGYCLLAFLHLIYLGWSGISSTAWDSTAEMMALAMNSSPTRHLQNTCAGIMGIKTFQTPVRILATNVGGTNDEHLELVFGQDEQENAHMDRLELNQKYGKLRID